MMQKTSLNKNIALKLFGFSLTKNLPVAAVSSVLVLLVSPVYLINMINNAFERNALRVDYTYSLDIYVLPYLLCGLAMAATAVGLLLLFTNFNFLFNKQSSDVYHALPLTRSQLFFARFGAAYVSALIPLGAGYLGVFFVGFMDRVELSHKMLLLGFIFTIIFMALCLLFSMLIIMLTGCVFDAIVALLVVNIGLPICVLPFDEIANNLIFGYMGNGLTEKAFVYGTPFGYALKNLNSLLENPEKPWFTLSRVVIVFAIIVVLSFIIVKVYNVRKSEKAGEAFAFGFVPYVISAIISTLGFFVLGSIFFGGLETYNPAFWIIGIIGALLCGVVYNAIVNRGFKKFKFSFIPSIIAILVVSLITISLAVDAFGIENYLPKTQNVEKIQVGFGAEEITVSGEDIQDIIDFHSDITQHKENVEVLDDDINGGEYHSVRFEYSLKGGKKVMRRYYIPAYLFADQFADFISGPYADYFETHYSPEGYDYFSISGNLPQSEKHYNCDITKQEYETLRSLYISDLRGIDAQAVKRGTREKGTSFHANMYTKTVGNYDYFYSYIHGDEFESFKYLETLNLIDRTQDEYKK